MPKKKGKRPPERSYARLTRHERQTIERMLDRGGCREIARELDRAPSTAASEVGRHRFVTSPRALRGECLRQRLFALIHNPFGTSSQQGNPQLHDPSTTTASVCRSRQLSPSKTTSCPWCATWPIIAAAI